MEKIIILIIFLSCALLPNYNVTQAMFKEIGGIVLMSLFIVSWVWKHNKWLAAFLLWLVIRMMLPPIQPRGMITLTNVFMAAMLYLATQYVKFNWKNIRIALSITLGLQVLAVVCQKLNIFFCWNSMNDGGRVWGLFGNSNWSGAYIAMMIPIAMSLGGWWTALGVLGIIALVIMKSSFAMLGALTGVAFILYYKNRKFILKNHYDKVILSILLATIAFVVLNPVYLEDSGRFETWRRSAKFCVYNPTDIIAGKTGGQDPAYQSHFIQGRGLGEAYTILPMIQEKHYTEKWRQTHNDLLQVLFEYGFIGLVLIAGLIITTLKKVNNQNIYIMASLLAIFVDSLGFFPFRTSPIGYIAILLLGAIDKDAILL